jgi:hypothetical protein
MLYCYLHGTSRSKSRSDSPEPALHFCFFTQNIFSVPESHPSP